MAAELLMMRPGYGPFIHAGADNNVGRTACRQAHPMTFGLWASLDGQLTYDDGSDAAPLRLPGPAAVFVTPGPEQIVAAPAGSRWYYLRFDVVDQPRRRRSCKQAWCHSEAVSQPSPRAIWGVDLPARIPEHHIGHTIQLLRDCCALWWRNDHCHARANARLGSWLMDYVMLALPPSAIVATGKGFHQQCRELIHERLGLGIDVVDLAAAWGYSRVHFARRFKAETGMHPGAFIREERMAHACHLLAKTDWGLQEVADECGYRSLAAFSRAFAAHWGSAPGTWRRRYR